VTESRVCQIHTKAVLQLRAKLADRPEAAGRRAPTPKSKSSTGSGDGGTSGRTETKAAGAAAGAKAPKRVPTSATG
jgi:hypothetical protein